MPKGVRDERLKGKVFNLYRVAGDFIFEKMQIKIFTIPIGDTGEMQVEMNRFLAANRVLEIEQYFYQNDKGAFWSFCVRYLSTSLTHYQVLSSKKKTDYKEILSEGEFAIFSKLREARKTIAANDAVPAYAVFTDEELASIACLPSIEVNKLIAIKGIGDKKIEKYGKPLLDLYTASIKDNEKGE